MAENKKSFITYCEWQETFNELSDEEAGILIKHIFSYVNDENPETDNKVVKMCFIPIKQILTTCTINLLLKLRLEDLQLK